MDISLTPESNNFIASQVSGGRFSSTNEAVEEAVKLLKLREEKVQWLRDEIQKGLDSESIDGEKLWLQLINISRINTEFDFVKFVLKEQARLDLKDIFDYIASDNITAAYSFKEIIYKKIRLIAEYPYIGINKNHLKINLRSLPFRNYIIYFIPGKIVEIARIIHSARDIDETYFKN